MAVTYRDGFTCPQAVTHPSNRAQCRLTTLIEANTPSTTLRRHILQPGRRHGVVLGVTVLAGEWHVQCVVVVDRLEGIKDILLVVVGDSGEWIKLGSDGGGSQILNVDVRCCRERIVGGDLAAEEHFTADVSIIVVVVVLVSTPINIFIYYSYLPTAEHLNFTR